MTILDHTPTASPTTGCDHPDCKAAFQRYVKRWRYELGLWPAHVPLELPGRGAAGARQGRRG